MSDRETTVFNVAISHRNMKLSREISWPLGLYTCERNVSETFHEEGLLYISEKKALACAALREKRET